MACVFLYLIEKVLVLGQYFNIIKDYAFEDTNCLRPLVNYCKNYRGSTWIKIFSHVIIIDHVSNGNRDASNRTT